MYETLLGSDRVTQELYPMLAEEWSMAPDGMSWSFKLRQGIPFYQNKQPTAYQVTRQGHSLHLRTGPNGRATVGFSLL